MSPRTGRPPIENPKSERITVRLDREHSEILNEYCEENKVDRAEAVREGIKRLKKIRAIDHPTSKPIAPTEVSLCEISYHKGRPLSRRNYAFTEEEPPTSGERGT